MQRIALLGLVVTSLTAASPVPQQISPRQNEQAASSPQLTPEPDDIIVEGLLDLPPNVNTAARPAISANSDPRESAVANRQKLEFSQRIAGCAGRGKLSNLSHLRNVVDGPPNKASQVYAQDLLKRINVTCSEGVALQQFEVPNLGRSIYDRGALTIEVLNRYAPDLKLTAKETSDPVVQARFNALEVERNRYRLPVDYKYFEVAVCMVRVQPRLSLRLARTNGPPKQIKRIASTIVDNANVCVGGARKVYFDPTQFRLYIADAVYRWAVAAKGVDSLVPRDAVLANKIGFVRQYCAARLCDKGKMSCVP